MIDSSNRPPEFVEALAKGLAVLEAFDNAHPEMTLSEIARRVKASPAAVRRSLITLEALGYVGQSGKRFHLQPKVMGLGSAFYFAARIDELMLPELRHLVETFGDAASVATLDVHDVIYIAHHSRQRARRASAVVGARYPAHATSMGRVLLAGLDEVRLESYFATVEPQALTALTVTSVEALRDIIEEVRRQGYATAVDQLDYGITALAVPVRGPDGNTVAALNSSGYSGLTTPEKMVNERLHELRLAASRIGEAVTRYPVLTSILTGR
ncbi:MAG: helix-turn-helix domain-containing protein [Pararhodobacter sp.]|nr:helix-turn-helix domain-containing protein [Pararhodobacter sp.]